MKRSALVIVGGVVVVLSAWLPWEKLRWSRLPAGVPGSLDLTIHGWQGPAGWAVPLLGVGLVLMAIAMLRSHASPEGFATGIVVMSAVVIASTAIVAFQIVTETDPPRLSHSVAIGIYVALAGAACALAGGLALRRSEEARSEPSLA